MRVPAGLVSGIKNLNRASDTAEKIYARKK
jgi:hypothetical protein